MAYTNRYLKTMPPPPVVTQAEDQSWKPDETKDDFYGPDETDYWSAIDSDKKAQQKQERAIPKSRSKKVDELNVKIIEWEQPKNLETTLLNDIEAAHKQQPHPITYTVVDPSADPTAPDTKRRIFGNLHRQLQQEVERAFVCGSWMSVSAEVVNEAKGHAGKATEEWEDVDMALFEPRIREVVKLLIAKRREVEAA